VGIVGLALTMAVATLYLRAASSAEAPHGRAVVIAILALSSGSIAAVLSRLRTRASRMVVTNTVVLSVLLIQIPSLARYLELAPLHLDDWALVVLTSALAAGGAAIAAIVGGTAKPRERLLRPVQHVANHGPARSSGRGVLTEDPVRK